MTFPLSYIKERVSDAQKLQDSYGFVYNNDILPRLHLTDDKLVLLNHDFKPIFVDFTNNAILKRAQQTKNQGLIKACKPQNSLKIIDATAGFGRDAFILACLGAEVVMLEKSPILAALLIDGLARLEHKAPDFCKLSLIYSDAIQYITDLKPENIPDVIYIDPMHPTRKKKALVKKEMQILQSILGPDNNAEQLLIAALSKAKQRVVVKWPQRELPLRKPNYSINGKTVRFDVYST